jgi:hypothetical protein
VRSRSSKRSEAWKLSAPGEIGSHRALAEAVDRRLHQREHLEVLAELVHHPETSVQVVQRGQPLVLSEEAGQRPLRPWPGHFEVGPRENVREGVDLQHLRDLQDGLAVGVAGLADLVGLAGLGQRQAAGLQMARALARTTTGCQRPGAGIAGITALRGGVEGAGP